jgi:hypothetical protein
MAGVSDEVNKRVKRFGRKRDDRVALTQLPFFRVE